ncbi:MAG: lysozyme inhibitor LprI family protein [Leptothrix ochracea]|uniref:lysozyme inhibitor LprI family protein n=1 Tax=Leptothrix ochracea TaxID=735331 RepID=UPI0034E2CFDB
MSKSTMIERTSPRLTPLHLVRTLVITSLLTSSVSAFSQRASSGQECFAQGANADARKCLAAMANRSDWVLVQAERDVANSLEQAIEEPMVRQRAVVALESASAAYRRYRQEQCGFQVALAAGGSGATHRRLLCEIALNEERTSQMRSIQGIVQ